MSKFAYEISRLAKDRTKGWSDTTKVRFHEALESLCEDPESGRQYAEDDTWSYEDKSAKPHIHITYRIDRGLRRVKVLVADCTILPQIREVHVFLSYSHKDREWFEELRQALQPLEDLDVHFWCDKDIVAGQTWFALILEKLSDASAALLLVSEAFLQSEFICKHELGTFLARAEDPAGEPFLLLWIPLASRKAIEVNDLGSRLLQYQALLDPKKPLSRIRSEKSVASTLSKLREEAFRAIYRKLRKSA